MKYSKQTLDDLKAYTRQQIINDSKMMEFLLLNRDLSDSLAKRLTELAKNIKTYTTILEVLDNTEAE